MQVGIGQVNHAILPPLQEQKGDKGHHGGSGLNDADEKIVPCFSEDEFRAMSDGFRDVEPYDEITTWWEANGDVEESGLGRMEEKKERMVMAHGHREKYRRGELVFL